MSDPGPGASLPFLSNMAASGRRCHPPPPAAEETDATWS